MRYYLYRYRSIPEIRNGCRVEVEVVSWSLVPHSARKDLSPPTGSVYDKRDLAQGPLVVRWEAARARQGQPASPACQPCKRPASEISVAAAPAARQGWPRPRPSYYTHCRSQVGGPGGGKGRGGSDTAFTAKGTASRPVSTAAGQPASFPACRGMQRLLILNKYLNVIRRRWAVLQSTPAVAPPPFPAWSRPQTRCNSARRRSHTGGPVPRPARVPQRATVEAVTSSPAAGWTRPEGAEAVREGVRSGGRGGRGPRGNTVTRDKQPAIWDPR